MKTMLPARENGTLKTMLPARENGTMKTMTESRRVPRADGGAPFWAQFVHASRLRGARPAGIGVEGTTA
jgi:hypothetical protein